MESHAVNCLDFFSLLLLYTAALNRMLESIALTVNSWELPISTEPNTTAQNKQKSENQLRKSGKRKIKQKLQQQQQQQKGIIMQY